MRLFKKSKKASGCCNIQIEEVKETPQKNDEPKCCESNNNTKKEASKEESKDKPCCG
ncbi:hypothetical protein [Thermophagus xiamenensis]|uniref:Uncharacterized protein n=1 Tax=Thermophagus xiamenensis TaxID=385682 RepID=A0A1I2CY24_9BACT|nr:hypothetical protein [Thermophagus xiamenensis]SFE72640.1 hypothetical protein SAMN05444380_11732 [Thermophagus xiamenensis]